MKTYRVRCSRDRITEEIAVVEVEANTSAEAEALAAEVCDDAEWDDADTRYDNRYLFLATVVSDTTNQGGVT